MSLEQWHRNSWVKEWKTNASEIADLFAVVDREIADASVVGLSTDGRYMHAYDAALNLCAIALKAHGYTVPKGAGHHKRTIEALPLILGANFQSTSDEVELASRLRGQAMYDRADVVREEDSVNLFATVTRLRSEIFGWRRHTHPSLLAKSGG